MVTLGRDTGDEELGRKLRAARKEKGLPVNDIIETVGVSASALQHFEIGKSMPTVVSLAKLAAYYGVSVDYLISHIKENSDN